MVPPCLMVQDRRQSTCRNVSRFLQASPPFFRRVRCTGPIRCAQPARPKWRTVKQNTRPKALQSRSQTLWRVRRRKSFLSLPPLTSIQTSSFKSWSPHIKTKNCNPGTVAVQSCSATVPLFFCLFAVLFSVWIYRGAFEKPFSQSTSPVWRVNFMSKIKIDFAIGIAMKSQPVTPSMPAVSMEEEPPSVAKAISAARFADVRVEARILQRRHSVVSGSCRAVRSYSLFTSEESLVG